jgi:hypothetical protein
LFQFEFRQFLLFFQITGADIAYAEDVQIIIAWHKLFDLRILNLRFQFGVGMFRHFVANRTNRMEMKIVVVSPLVERQIFPELMFQYQIAFQQQLHRVVECCPTDAKIALSQFFMQSINIEMA